MNIAVESEDRPARTTRPLEHPADGPPLTALRAVPGGAGREAGRPGAAGDVVIALAGEIDLSTAARVRAELRLAEALGPARLILDMRGVTFIDAAGIAAILPRRRAGDVRRTVVAGPGRVRRVLELVGADRVIEVLEAPPEPDWLPAPAA